MKTISEFENRIITGDCIQVMQEMPAASIDFIATDPPYLVGYTSRDGRRIAGDDNEQVVVSGICPDVPGAQVQPLSAEFLRLEPG